MEENHITDSQVGAENHLEETPKSEGEIVADTADDIPAIGAEVDIAMPGVDKVEGEAYSEDLEIFHAACQEDEWR